MVGESRGSGPGAGGRDRKRGRDRGCGGDRKRISDRASGRISGDCVIHSGRTARDNDGR